MNAEANQILLIHGHEKPRNDIRKALRTRYTFRECAMHHLEQQMTPPPLAIIVDMPLGQEVDVLGVQHALQHLPVLDIGRAFILDDLTRATIVRAHAFGGEVIIPRPINRETLFSSVDLLLAKARARTWAQDFQAEARGLEAGTALLQRIFQFASGGGRLKQHDLHNHGDAVIDSLAQTGLGRWIQAVKEHHSQTFRHSLLVTGIAVSFGQHLGMNANDLRRLSLGGMLHDIGKAAIPIDILEKPGPLTELETQTMREHANFGRQILIQNGGFAPEMIDVVAHHHELLDGSGYPDALMGDKISDLVRVMTIADIFAALIEERAYKSGITNTDAFEVLKSMGNKLDTALVRAFEPVAMQTRQTH